MTKIPFQIIGNWKMNLLSENAQSLAKAIAAGASNTPENAEITVCVPHVYLTQVAECLKGDEVNLGAQNCSFQEAGAYTGDISAAMLKDTGCSHVILGHSERRSLHGEDDYRIRSKAKMALAEGLTRIICVGETLGQREAGEAMDVVKSQLEASIPDESTAADTIIAYEPVWAIGTGKTASIADITAMHDHIRSYLDARFTDGERWALLYGGSVKPANAAEIFSVCNVNGALIGGASLKADSFLAIADAAGQTSCGCSAKAA